MNSFVSPNVRAIFFDAVGTLIQPYPPAPAVYTEVGHRHGSQLDVATIASRFRTAFEREEEIDRTAGWRTNEVREAERWRRIVRTVLDDVIDPKACFTALFAHFSRPQAWRINPDAARVFPTLAGRGYTLGVASNFDHRLRGIAAGLPEFRLLSHVVISSEVGWRKPAPKFFAALCDQVALPPEQILLVGDDWGNDIQGARASGLQAVLVDPDNRGRTHVRIRCLRELVE